MSQPRTIRPPSDKSITHRALALAALSKGRSVLEEPLISLDARSMAGVLRAVGIPVSPLRGEAVRIDGNGVRGFRAPNRTLNCGNSGTTARLMLGMLAGSHFAARVNGDASLRRRPMRRVTHPLSDMGAHFEELNGDGLPLRVRGGALRGITYDLPVASAQVKSAILLAALVGGVPVALREPGSSRDHTERMLEALGASLKRKDGWISFVPPDAVSSFATRIPGDPSSAAFLAAAAVLAGSGLLITEVGINPTRTGFIHVLRRMGARVEVIPRGEQLGEPVGDLLVSPGSLTGTEVDAREVPTLIDEIPILAAVAAQAEGPTIFRGIAELRVKESDRLHLLSANLRSLGCEAEASADSLLVSGLGLPLRGQVDTAGDHRMAMAFSVLAAAVPESNIRLSEVKSAAVSYPSFFADLRRVLADG